MSQPCQYVEDIIESRVMISQLAKSIESIDKVTTSTHDKVEDMSERLISLEKSPVDKGFAAGLVASGAIMGSIASSVLITFGKVGVKSLIALTGTLFKI